MFGFKKNKSEKVDLTQLIEKNKVTDLSSQQKVNNYFGMHNATDDFDKKTIEIAEKMIKVKAPFFKEHLDYLSNKNIVLACFAVIKNLQYDGLKDVMFYGMFDPLLCHDSDFIEQSVLKYGVPVKVFTNMSKSNDVIFDSQKDEILAKKLISKSGLNIKFFDNEIKNSKSFLKLAITSKAPYMPQNAYQDKDAVLLALNSKNVENFQYDEYGYRTVNIMKEIMEGGALNNTEISKDSEFIEKVIDVYKSKKIEEIKKLETESRLYDERKTKILHDAKEYIEHFREDLQSEQNKPEPKLTTDQQKSIDELMKF